MLLAVCSQYHTLSALRCSVYSRAFVSIAFQNQDCTALASSVDAAHVVNSFGLAPVNGLTCPTAERRYIPQSLHNVTLALKMVDASELPPQVWAKVFEHVQPRPAEHRPGAPFFNSYTSSLARELGFFLALRQVWVLRRWQLLQRMPCKAD